MNLNLKWIKRLLYSFVSIYLLYVAGIILILNTPIFAWISDMKDERLTHVRFKGAVSFLPGYLYVRNAKIYVGDQNVSFQFLAHDASLRFKIRPLFDRVIDVSKMTVSQTDVKLNFKTEDETESHYEAYTTPEDVDVDLRKKTAEAASKKRIVFRFPDLDLKNVHSIETPNGRFEGDLVVKGGFQIQPGVEAEVFPTHLQVRGGIVPEKFRDIRTDALVTIEKFSIPDHPGNVVFKKVSFSMEGTAFAETLDFINVTLKSLPDYKIHEGASNVWWNFQVKQGLFQENSFLKTDLSTMLISTPSFQARGVGKAFWGVKSNQNGKVEGVSKLKIDLKKVNIEMKESPYRFSLSNLDTSVDLFGTDMQALFKGLIGNLKLDRLVWNGSPVVLGDSKQKPLILSGLVRGKGEISGAAGEVPKAAFDRQTKRGGSFQLDVQKLKLALKDFATFNLNGTITAKTTPIDFRTGRMNFPVVKADLNTEIEGSGQSNVQAKVQDVNYWMTGEGQWKGKLALSVLDTKPIVNLLASRGQVSGIVKSLLEVKDLSADVDWELNDDYLWARVNELHSSGIWTTYGSIVHDSNELYGVFETKVGFLPIGIQWKGATSKIKVLPSKSWYETAK